MGGAGGGSAAAAALPQPRVAPPDAVAFISLYTIGVTDASVDGAVEEREESHEEWVLRRTDAFTKLVRCSPYP